MPVDQYMLDANGPFCPSAGAKMLLVLFFAKKLNS